MPEAKTKRNPRLSPRAQQERETHSHIVERFTPLRPVGATVQNKVNPLNAENQQGCMNAYKLIAIPTSQIWSEEDTC